MFGSSIWENAQNVCLVQVFWENSQNVCLCQVFEKIHKIYV
jgi:hypothetical protein